MMIGEGHGPVAHPLDPPLTVTGSTYYVVPRIPDVYI